MKYTTNDLIIFALFASIVFAFEYTICPILAVVAGMPGSCGMVGVIFEAFFGVLAALITRKPFAFAITMLITSFLFLPTPVLFGVPHIIGLLPLTLSALLAEPFIRKYTMKSSAIGGAVYMTATNFAVMAVLIFLGLPGAETWTRLLPYWYIAVGAVLGMILTGAGGAIAAVFVYNKIKNKTFIRRLQK